MSKQYKWKTTLAYENEISPENHLSHGVSPEMADWQTGTVGEAGSSGEITYWYRDSNTLYSGQYVDSLSSRVAYNVTQSWITSADSHNNLTVSVTTVINSIVRDDIRGVDQNTPGRNINVYKEEGGAAVISVTDNQVATAHTIQAGPVNLGTYTFTLAPGQNLTKNTLFIHNQTVGSSSYDDIWAGVRFMNTLPADHRVGASLDTNTGIWKSHNRTNGACHVLSNVGNMTWTEMRNIGDGTNQGDPPLILKAANDHSWYDQRNLGKE